MGIRFALPTTSPEFSSRARALAYDTCSMREGMSWSNRSHPRCDAASGDAARRSSTTTCIPATGRLRSSGSHAKVTPAGRHSASASSRILRRRDGETVAAAAYAIRSGGAVIRAGAASTTIPTSIETSSIMSVIDGVRCEKFDVRNRDERTVCESRADAVRLRARPSRRPRAAGGDESLDLEIHGDDVLAEARTELRDRHVTRVLLVRIERGAIGELDRQARIVGARRLYDVAADDQRDDPRNVVQSRQTIAVLVEPRFGDVRPVLEAHEMHQHLQLLTIGSARPGNVRIGAGHRHGGTVQYTHRQI